MMLSANHEEGKVRTQVNTYLKGIREEAEEANAVQTVQDLLNYAIKHKDRSTAILIEFVWREKGVVSLKDNVQVIYQYLNPKHRERLNIMLTEFIYSGKSIYNDLIKL
jgi:hypothetical protein